MKISQKGQVVIPAEVRRRYGWKPGVRVVLKDASPSQVVLRKKKQPSRGIGTKYQGVLKDLLPSREERRAMKEEDLRLEA